jgi:hypothetical protein
MEIVGDLLRSCGEFLPVISDEPLAMFHPLVVGNAIDLDRSEVHRFSSGRIMAVTSYVFIEEALPDAPLFLELGNELFCRQSFVDLVTNHALTGITFRRVWPIHETDGSASRLRTMVESSRRSAASRGLDADPPASEHPLPNEAAEALGIARVDAFVVLDLGPDVDATTLQAAIRRAVARWHADPGWRQTLDEDALAIVLGAAWGDAACRGLGWEWAWMVGDGWAEAAVVARDRSAFVTPISVLGDALSDPNRQTTMLLYNMILDGLAPAEPGELRPLS